jgi:hypothetical protein
MSRNRVSGRWGVGTTNHPLQGGKIQTLGVVNQACLRVRSSELGEEFHRVKRQSARGEPVSQRGQVLKTVSHLHQTTAKRRIDTKPGRQPLGHVGSAISQELLAAIGFSDQIACPGKTGRYLAEHVGQSISGRGLESLSPNS